MVGRNDPCSCGSGKKYKKCCLQHEVIQLAEVRYERAYERLLTELEPFCLQYKEEGLHAAIQFFGAEASPSLSESMAYAFLDWMIFNYRDFNGETLLERFLGEIPDLSGTEQEMVRSWIGSRPGVYRVRPATDGQVVLEDYLSGNEYRVRLQHGWPAPPPGDLLIGRIIPVGAGYHFGFDARSTKGEGEPAIRRVLEYELARMRLQQPAAGWPNLFAERWPIVREGIELALGTDCQVPPEVDGPASLGITCSPSGASPLEGEVAEVLVAYLLGAHLPQVSRTRAVRLWWDAAAALQPRSGKAEVWAAGVAYAFHHYALHDDMTQTLLADTIGVSVSSLAARARAIAGVLKLEVLDDRYADPLDPGVRLIQRLYWMNHTAAAVAPE